MPDILQALLGSIATHDPNYRNQQELNNQLKLRATPSAYEQFEMNRQTGLDKQAVQDRQTNFMAKMADMEAKGLVQRVDRNGNDIDPGAPDTSIPSQPGFDFKTQGTATPPTTTPPTQNFFNLPGPSGDVAGNNPASPGSSTGAGPSDRPTAAQLLFNRNNPSQASTAQPTPAGLTESGPTTPAQTASGSSPDSGAVPGPTTNLSPAQKATYHPDLSSPDGNVSWRFTTPDEQISREHKLAVQQAAADRDTKMQQFNAFLQTPYAKDLSDYSKTGLAAEIMTGQKIPEATASQMEAELMDKAQKAYEKGDMNGYQMFKELLGAHLNHGQLNAPAQLAKRPDGTVYQVQPGVTMGPGDQILGKEGQTEKTPTPQIGYVADKDVNGNITGYHTMVIRGNESNLPAGLQSQSGVNSVSTPTTQSRNMGEMAATVVPQAERVKQEVAEMAQKIGPAAGRWNQLMVNKAGVNGADFAGLDTDLDLLSSAIVRTHFGARGGQHYQQVVKNMLSAAQSPEDLVSRINHAEGWLRGYAQAGGAKITEGATPNDWKVPDATGGPVTPASTNGPAGAPPPPKLPPPAIKGQKLDPKTAQVFVDAFGGDKNKAREAAKNLNWTF